MILKNMDEVLAAIANITAQVKEDMIGMDDRLLPRELIEQLCPIMDGICFMKKNNPGLAIHLSLAEISVLSKITTVELTT